MIVIIAWNNDDSPKQLGIMLMVQICSHDNENPNGMTIIVLIVRTCNDVLILMNDNDNRKNYD